MRKISAVCVLLMALAACDTMDTNDGDDTGASAVIGPAGGKVQGEGVSIDVPAGALDENVTITATENGDAPAGHGALSPVYQFGPEGTVFKKPITITLTMQKAEPRAVVWFTKLHSSEFEDLGGTALNTKISVQVTHFSQAFAGLPEENDAGTTPEHDGGTTDTDSGTPAMDSGTPGMDSGMLEPDGGQVETDAGHNMQDAHVGTDDSGTTQTDAGAADAGHAQEDSGSGSHDAGSSASDAGQQGNGSVSISVRNSAGALASMTWAAFQDGDGAWTQITPVDTGLYSVNVSAAGYGLAFVCANGDNSQSMGQLLYLPRSTTELALTADNPCAPVTQKPSYKLGGVIANKPDNSTYVRMGMRVLSGASVYGTSPSGPTYAIYNFAENDSYDVAIGPATDTLLTKIMFVRGVTLSADKIDQDVDFGTAYDTGYAGYSVSNANNGTTSVNAYYTTEGAELGISLARPGTQFGNATLYGSYSSIPETPRVPTDRYQLTATDSAGSDVRTVQRRFYTGGDIQMALPNAFAVTLGTVSTPYTRETASFNSYQGATHYQFAWSYGPSKGVYHNFNTEIDPAYLTGESHELTFPDFSGVSAFKSEWFVPTGFSSSLYLSGTATVSSTLADGTQKQTAQHSLNLVP
jgi:hypothetical protein